MPTKKNSALEAVTAEIFRTHQALQQQGRQINAPYALLVSALSYALFLKYIVYGSDSIFGATYQAAILDSTNKQLSHDTLEDVKQEMPRLQTGLQQGLSDINDGLSQIFQRFDQGLESPEAIRKSRLAIFKEELGVPQDIPDDVFFHNLEATTHGFTRENKQMLIESFNKVIDNFYNMPEVLARPNTDKMSLSELFDAAFVGPALATRTLLKRAITQSVKITYAEEATKNFMGQTVLHVISTRAGKISDYVLQARFLPELLGLTFYHHCIVKPALNHVFPNGLSFRPTTIPPLPKNVRLLSGTQRDALLATYTTALEILSENSLFARNISRALVMFFATMAIVLDNSEWAPFLWLAIGATLTMSLTNSLSDWQQHQHTRQEKRRIEDLLFALNAEYRVSDGVEHITLLDSTDCIELLFTKITLEEETLSENKVCRAFRSALNAQRVEIYYTERDALVISAKSALKLLQGNALSDLKQSVREYLLALIKDRKFLRALHEIKDQPTPFATSEALKTLSIRKQTRQLPTIAAPIEKAEKAIPASTTRILTWAIGQEQISSNDPRVTPVRNGDGHHYTLNLIDRDQCDPHLFKALNDVISTQPKFVCDKGQGLKTSKETGLKTLDANILPGSYKAKPKGFGARAHAYKATTKTGEALHVFTTHNVFTKHRS